jgi:hypothetical protein
VTLLSVRLACHPSTSSPAHDSRLSFVAFWGSDKSVLVIHAEQMTAFELAARRQFEEEMVVHSKSISPRLCEVIGDEQLRVALRSAINRATGSELRHRETATCGSFFS